MLPCDTSNMNYRLSVAIEQVNVMESAGGPSVLALHSPRVFLALQILSFFIESYFFDRSRAVCSLDPIGISKSFREALRVSL